MWSYLDEENTSRAAKFSRDRTSDTASDWNTDLETDDGRSAAVAIRRSSQKRSSSYGTSLVCYSTCLLYTSDAADE